MNFLDVLLGLLTPSNLAFLDAIYALFSGDAVRSLVNTAISLFLGLLGFGA